MTHIVSPTRYKSKKAFKEAVNKDPSKVYLDDHGCVESAHVLAMAPNRNPTFALVDPRCFEPYPAGELVIKKRRK